MSSNGKWAVFLATGCGVGRIPFAPGTFGTLWGVPMAWILGRMLDASWLAAILFLGAFALFSIWCADAAAEALGAKDPGSVVIDEVAGYMVTLFAIPFTWKAAAAGFIFFRIFDILKPTPVGTLDRRLTGGLGIVADDLMAGVYANIVLRVFLHFF